jgi:arylsulfatase A-like enzyme
MYEGGIKVPMAAVWPGHIAAGSRSERVATVMDLYATAAEVAGIAVTHKIDAHSILPTLLGAQQPPEERALIFVRREGGNNYMGETIWAVRKGDWKLLKNMPTEPFELYNLQTDPLEERNLALEERQKLNELSEVLRLHIQQSGAIPWQERW